MRIELKTNNLSEIIQICKNNNYDIKKVKFDSEIWTDFSTNEDSVKLFLVIKKK